jgi:predicted small metal-binding protein
MATVVKAEREDRWTPIVALVGRVLALGWTRSLRGTVPSLTPLARRALMKAVHCPCGEVIEAETDDELVEKTQLHVREDHPELESEYTREKILSIAHDH